MFSIFLEKRSGDLKMGNSLFGVFILCVVVSVVCGNTLKFQPMSQFQHNEAQKDEWPPKFCNKLDCPKYTVEERTEDYELRKYELSNWVTTELANIEWDKARNTMFFRLFDYISGKNSKEEKIAMTVPVITRIIPGQGPACETNFTMSFFIAPKVKDPPAPTNPEVQLSKLPELRAYVTSFGGYASLNDYTEHATALAKALPKTASYHTDFYYMAGYNSPFQFLFRHNEVWFIAK